MKLTPHPLPHPYQSGRAVSRGRPRLHLAAAAGPHPRHPMGSRRLAAELVDSRVGRRTPAAISRRRHRRDPELLEREHLLSGTADARLLRAPVRAGGPDSPGLRADGQHHPFLQPAVSLDVRAVGARHVSVRARHHRQRARGAGRGPGLRVRAVSRSAVFAPPGHLLAVDAVRALWSAAILRDETHPGARRRRRRAHRAEPFERVLPALLRTVRARVRIVRDCDPKPLEGRARLGGPLCNGGRRHPGDAAVSASVPRAAPAWVRRRAS